mmetsp:Transcript_1381/g.2278  ORF Transcript_1381/g.2278 Transcript_1381/m.2278 type:complete len:455 (-) Transcript_1381:14-1378(-)
MKTRSVVSLCFCNGVNAAIDGSVVPLAVFLSAHFGDGNEVWVPLLITGSRVGRVIGVPLFGWFADHVGYKRAGYVVLLINILCCILNCFVENLAVILATRFFLGTSSFTLIGNNWIHRNSSDKEATRLALAWYSLTNAFGLICGISISGVLALLQPAVVWKAVNGFWVLLSCISVVLLWKFTEKPKSSKVLVIHKSIDHKSIDPSSDPSGSKVNGPADLADEEASSHGDTSLTEMAEMPKTFLGSLKHISHHFAIQICFGLSLGYLFTLTTIYASEPPLNFQPYIISCMFFGTFVLVVAFTAFAYKPLIRRLGLWQSLLLLGAFVTLIDVCVQILFAITSVHMAKHVMLLCFFVLHAVFLSQMETMNQTLVIENAPRNLEGRIVGILISAQQLAMVAGSFSSLPLYRFKHYLPYTVRSFLMVCALVWFYLTYAGQSKEVEREESSEFRRQERGT